MFPFLASKNTGYILNSGLTFFKLKMGIIKIHVLTPGEWQDATIQQQLLTYGKIYP